MRNPLKLKKNDCPYCYRTGRIIAEFAYGIVEQTCLACNGSGKRESK